MKSGSRDPIKVSLRKKVKPSQLITTEPIIQNDQSTSLTQGAGRDLPSNSSLAFGPLPLDIWLHVLSFVNQDYLICSSVCKIFQGLVYQALSSLDCTKLATPYSLGADIIALQYVLRFLNLEYLKLHPRTHLNLGEGSLFIKNLSTLPKLQILDLSNFCLTGTEDFSQFSLQTLRADQIHPSIHQLTSLTCLDLSSSRIPFQTTENGFCLPRSCCNRTLEWPTLPDLHGTISSFDPPNVFSNPIVFSDLPGLSQSVILLNLSGKKILKTQDLTPLANLHNIRYIFLTKAQIVCSKREEDEVVELVLLPLHAMVNLQFICFCGFKPRPPLAFFQDLADNCPNLIFCSGGHVTTPDICTVHQFPYYFETR